jgi:arylformamidase
VHGGTWRFGVAADNAFFAETFVKAGISVVVPDFSSVDEFDGNLEGLVDQLQRAVKWVHAHAGEFGGDPERHYLSGFSSGAHLASVLLTSDWVALGVPAHVFRGALLCSGMYDMTPVALSSRREFVNLGPDNIPLLSPQLNVEKINTPLIVACGTRETPEFQRQAREFAAALTAAGREVQLINATEYNHFEIIETLGSPYGVLGREMLRMIVQHQ